MLRTFPQTRAWNVPARLAMVAVFTLLTILAARVTLEIGPVPLTLQTLAVFLAGLVLGARDGALSQIAYVGLIALNLPFDARGLGAAVFAGPTWGYLLGFIACAYVIGWLVEHHGGTLLRRTAAAWIGSLFVFVPGVIVLQMMTGMTWQAAITGGFVEFQVENLIKVLLAASIAEGTRSLLLRALLPLEKGQ